MHLTTEQQQALDLGQAVEITLDGRPCVILRREVYYRAQEEYDDGSWTKEEMDRLAAETADILERDGLDEPLKS